MEWTENPRVGSSILSLATKTKKPHIVRLFSFPTKRFGNLFDKKKGFVADVIGDFMGKGKFVVGTAYLLLYSYAFAAPHGDIEQPGITLPTEFRNDQIFFTPITTNGETLTFFTDSGGGYNALSEEARLRAGLGHGEPLKADGKEYATTPFPEFLEDGAIPDAPAGNWMEGRLVVVSDPPFREDGFLGGRYFADRVWVFDYQEQLVQVAQEAPSNASEAMELGFQKNRNGDRTSNFARVVVTVDHEPIDMLFDTGATVTLTEEAGTIFDQPVGTRIGGSYIIRSIFDKWQQAHPDWQVIEAGDRLSGRTFRMIQVPKIKIGHAEVGPVWFTERPDRAFTEWMSGMMDKPIAGAVGGSGLKYFRVIVDYPNARAWFIALGRGASRG